MKKYLSVFSLLLATVGFSFLTGATPVNVNNWPASLGTPTNTTTNTITPTPSQTPTNTPTGSFTPTVTDTPTITYTPTPGVTVFPAVSQWYSGPLTATTFPATFLQNWNFSAALGAGGVVFNRQPGNQPAGVTFVANEEPTLDGVNYGPINSFMSAVNPTQMPTPAFITINESSAIGHRLIFYSTPGPTASPSPIVFELRSRN